MASVIEACDPDEKLPTPSEFVMRGTLAAHNTTRSYLCDRHWDWYKYRSARLDGASGGRSKVAPVQQASVAGATRARGGWRAADEW